MSRKKSREYAFRLVFEKFFHEPDTELSFNDEEINTDEIDKDFVSSLFDGISSNYQEIIDIIKNNTLGYEIDRIYKIDLAILVVAVFELKFQKSNPELVIINEAIELAKKYSTDKSYSFINGVLAKILK